MVGCHSLGLTTSNDKYSEMHQTARHQEKVLINLAWEIRDLTELNQSGRTLLVDLKCLLDELEDESTDLVAENLPQTFSSVRKRLGVFIKGVTRHKRTAATHLLVFMISPEERNKKPYAIPVQCIPYSGLSDSKIRILANLVIEEMVKRNMKIAG